MEVSGICFTGMLSSPDANEAARALDDTRRAIEEDPLMTAPSGGLLGVRLPFGPFLCLAIVEWMLAAPWIAQLYPLR